MSEVIKKKPDPLDDANLENVIGGAVLKPIVSDSDVLLPEDDEIPEGSN